ncbi:MAG: DCC1-like thiol-disulfide oxidoreductase family protein, partial [Bacteroidota bacterium]
MATEQPILFFDGVCNLCNGAVQWFIRHDRRGELRFASLQSELAAELLPAAGVDPSALSSLVVYENGRAHTKSDGALRAGELVGGTYGTLAKALRIFPRGLRDWVYDFIAANRYRW